MAELLAVSDDPSPLQRSKPWWKKLWPGLSVLAAGLALVVTVVCAVAAYWNSASAFGRFSQVAGLPVSILAFGALTADAYYRKEGNKKIDNQVRLAAYTTLSMRRAVELAHGHIGEALDALDGGSPEQVGRSLTGAQTASYLAIASSMQSMHDLDLLAASGTIVADVKSRFDIDDQEIQNQRPRLLRGDDPVGSGDKASENEGSMGDDE